MSVDWSSQAWVAGVATLAGAAVAWSAAHRANPWDKAYRDAAKAELEIAKILRDDFQDDSYKAWVRSAKLYGNELTDPWNLLIRGARGAASGFAIVFGLSFSLQLTILLANDSQWARFNALGEDPGTRMFSEFPLAAVFAIASLGVLIATLATLLLRVGRFCHRILIPRRRRRLAERQGEALSESDPAGNGSENEPDDSGFLPRPGDQHPADG